MGDTKIEWATKVWNPTTGCTKVSQGCKFCYAERMANRFWKERKFTEVMTHPDRLEIPLHWKKPQRVFVDSMSDLFHPDVPDEFIREVFFVMYLPENRKHTFMILTKRPERMARMIHYTPDLGDHIWLGVSVEDQKTADERIPLLLQTNATVRFISCEPLLGPVNLNIGVCPVCEGCGETGGHYFQEDGMDTCDGCGGSGKAIDRVDWVIAGGESGPNARPMKIEWARSLRDQCQKAGVHFFFKQMEIDKKLVKMPELDGTVWNQYPESS